MSSPILQVRNLTTRLRTGQKIITVVDGLSFDLHAGKTLAIVGESGSGKSMTAFSIMGILPVPPALPCEGEILYKGENLLKLSEKQMQQIRGRKISMIFQDPMSALNPVYTIGEQLMETVEIHFNVEGKAREEYALKALEDVHLPNPIERMKEYPHQMSGGMLQRAMIAMALICDPDILIADEPTTALDVTVQAQILKLMKEIQKKRGMSILVITHDMGVVGEIADEVIVMYAGEQIERSSKTALFDHPAHPYTQALFDSRPSAIIPRGNLSVIKGQACSLADLPTGCRFHPRCDYVMEVCKTGKVPYFSLPETQHEAQHEVKCWLYDQELQFKMSNDETNSTD